MNTREPLVRLAVALGVMWMIIRYVPGGLWIGGLILLGAILARGKEGAPSPSNLFGRLLDWIGGTGQASPTGGMYGQVIG